MKSCIDLLVLEKGFGGGFYTCSCKDGDGGYGQKTVNVGWGQFRDLYYRFPVYSRPFGWYKGRVFGILFVIGKSKDMERILRCCLDLLYYVWGSGFLIVVEELFPLVFDWLWFWFWDTV